MLTDRLNHQSFLEAPKMGKKICFFLALGLALLISATPADAQEQWLQYYSAREARQIVSDMGLQGLELSTEKPGVVELPEFKTDSPLFAQWSTPMVKSSRIWIALDRTSEHGPHNLLYIDSNCNGHLNDETPVTSYRIEQDRSYFGPIKVVFDGEDGPISYHLNFEFYSREDNTYIYISSGGWYEGNITVEGAKKHCVLIDYNINGTFNDKSLEPGDCDRIRIGKKDSRDSRFVGNYIEVDGVLYQPEIAQDGAYIKIEKAKDVTFGNIGVPQTITIFAAGGENGLFTVKLEKGIGRLPVGKYRINQWEIERKDEKNNSWKLKGQWFRQKGDFEVTEASQTNLKVGEPITSTLQAREKDSTHYFDQNLVGQLEERIELTRKGAQPRAPKLNIKSKDGSYDRSFAFEYG
jgi:hypothetical protein